MDIYRHRHYLLSIGILLSIYNTIDTKNISYCLQTNYTSVRINVSDIYKLQFTCNCCDGSSIAKIKFNSSINNKYRMRYSNWTTVNNSFGSGYFALRLLSVDSIVIIPLEKKFHSPRIRNEHTSRPLFPKCPFYKNCIVMYHQLPTNADSIYIDTNTIGRTKFVISLIWWNVTRLPYNTVKFYLDDESYAEYQRAENAIIKQSLQQNVMDEINLEIIVVRKPNLFNVAFDMSSAFIAALLAFSVGCSVELKTVKSYVDNPKCVILGIFSQYFIMPAIALSLQHLLQLKPAIGLGLFSLAATPGGGLAHIIVFLMKGDECLSTTLSTLNGFLNSGISLLWIYFISKSLFNLPIVASQMAIWLCLMPLIYGIGITINRLHASSAQALLTWFTRPLLLLAGILFVTLGVYINNYAFSQINQKMVLGVMLLMLSGFLVGTIMGYIATITRSHTLRHHHHRHHHRHISNSTTSSSHHHHHHTATNTTSKDVICSLSVESSFFNALILIPALRYSLKQPEADIAASVCLWSVFFSPVPLFLIYISKRVQSVITRFIKTQFKLRTNHNVANSVAINNTTPNNASNPTSNCLNSAANTDHHHNNVNNNDAPTSMDTGYHSNNRGEGLAMQPSSHQANRYDTLAVIDASSNNDYGSGASKNRFRDENSDNNEHNENLGISKASNAGNRRYKDEYL